MRNLKKFLALVLAMLMTFSLMLTVNAATTSDFTDKDAVNEKFTEGVEVLKGMGVFEGYEDGTFQPKGEITRAEVATIVYRLATGDAEGIQAHLYKDYQKFDDVKADHWAAGYINYCANAEWIAGYGNGKFGPSDKVTGYQAAAMILRAVGYGKNNEFVGPTWQVQVANVTRSKGLLVNVNNTNYANTLNYPATRELIAEILFQAAQIPQVTWTMLGGYNEYDNALGNITGNDKNPSLGYENYGLTNTDAIVVANQATTVGQTYTSAQVFRANSDDTPAGASYGQAAPSGYTNATLRLDIETNLDKFGHKINVWYDDTARSAYDTVKRTVYAWSDEVKVAKMFTSNDADLSAAGALNGVIADVRSGFAASTSAYFSRGFGAFVKTGAGVSDKRSSISIGSPQNLYLAISNNAAKTVDVVVALNVLASKITAVDNLAMTGTGAANKTITFPVEQVPVLDISSERHNVTAPTNFVGTAGTNGTATTPHYDAASSAWATTEDAPIFQNRLSGKSTTTLNDYVIANALGGVVTGKVNGYNVMKITSTKVGKVSGYNSAMVMGKINVLTGNPQDLNYSPDTVTLEDGTKLEKSLLYYYVPVTNRSTFDATHAPDCMIPQQWEYDSVAGTCKESYNASTYRFFLDSEGKYIGAEPVYNEEFLYGTYVDADQALSTSTFKYYMTGVTLNGEIVTKEFDNWNYAKFNGNLDDLGAPYRNTTATTTAYTGIGNRGGYKGFVMNGTALTAGYVGTPSSTSGVTNAPKPNDLGVQSENDATYYPTGYFWNTSDLNITARDANVGAVQAASKGTGWVLNGDANNAPVYLTNDTKFILVSGHGTDTLKVEKVTGLKELLGSQSVVSIKTTSKNMFYYTTSTYQYANSTTGQTAQKIDTIIMPADAVRNNTSVYFYNGGNPIMRHTLGGDIIAEKYALYQDGEKVEVWLTGSNDDGASSTYASKNGFFGSTGLTATAGTATEAFYTLQPMTGDPTAPDGKPIYKAIAVADGAAAMGAYGIVNTDNGRADGALAFKGRIEDMTIGTINGVTYNTANAKVVNTVTGYDIDNLAKLNQASTLYNTVNVYAVQSSNGVISAIYVTAITP